MTIAKKYTTPNVSKGTNKRLFVIRHHTATTEGTAEAVVKRFCTSGSGVSCHYTISDTGAIYQIGSHMDILRHAGTSSRGKYNNLNQYSIGIEVVGPLKNGKFNDAQIKALGTLTRAIMESENIPIENVLRHKDIAPGRKIDISDTLRNDKYKSFDEAKQGIIFTGTITPDVYVDDWYSGAVQRAIDNNITTANKNTPFNPNQPATRAEVIQFLFNYHKAFTKK